MATEQSLGSPYRMQLLGEHAWQVSRAPSRPIDVEHIQYAAAVTERLYRENVENPTFADFGETHVRALVAVYNAPPGTTGEQIKQQIAEEQNLQLPYAQQILAHLQEANILDENDHGEMVFVPSSGLTPNYLRLMLTSGEPADQQCQHTYKLVSYMPSTRRALSRRYFRSTSSGSCQLATMSRRSVSGPQFGYTLPNKT